MKQSWKTLLLLGAASTLFACSQTSSGTSHVASSEAATSVAAYVRDGTFAVACDYENSVTMSVAGKTILTITDLHVGDKVTFTFDLHTDYYIHTFTINNVSKKDAVVNNQYTTTVEGTSFDVNVIITKNAATSASSSNA
jgi:hypothetical protein